MSAPHLLIAARQLLGVFKHLFLFFSPSLYSIALLAVQHVPRGFLGVR